MGVWKKVQAKAKVWKQERKYRKAAGTQIRKQAEAAYYKATAKERIKFAESKARIEREAREKRLKARYAPRKPMKYQAVSMFGGSPEPYFKSGGLVSPLFSQPSAPKHKVMRRKKVRKVRRRKVKQKYVIRGGKAYPIG